ncbi:hypothetical protein chiPu_0013815 [Chiloscyllium punctatum]|uniref:Family with sequence similarity 81 member B n=1 Tax=Chiloscyllium punctatum TaxID=137246 RepID=A0A401SY55_CHIPU|nr:hypothetical protein [Chiloscyllium punctatum]
MLKVVDSVHLEKIVERIIRGLCRFLYLLNLFLVFDVFLPHWRTGEPIANKKESQTIRDHTLLQVPVVTKSYLQMMDDRISNQERTTATLLEQAFQIKEDIITHLRGNQGHYPVEKVSQQLLENHIQVTARILKQLSNDIEVLEEQIRRRDGVTTGTSFAVHSLNQKHLLGIGDLRGRVARCDASISKLAGDVSITNNEIQKVKKDVQDAKSSFQEQIKELEIKVTQLLRNIDNSKCEHNTNLKTARGELQHELQRLDFKITTALTELQTQMQNQRKWAEYKLDKTETERIQRADHSLHVMQEKTDFTPLWNQLIH